MASGKDVTGEQQQNYMRKRVLFQGVAIVIVILILVRRRPVRPLADGLVKLNKIYTRTGDGGSAGLVDGSRVSKSSLRMAAIGDVDEANAAIGVAIAALDHGAIADQPAAHPERAVRPRRRRRDARRDRRRAAHRRQPGRAARARDRRDERRSRAARPASSCPSGSAAVAALHLARTVVRRAERAAVALNEAEPLNPQRSPISIACPTICSSPPAFVAAREGGDVLWQPGATRA